MKTVLYLSRGKGKFVPMLNYARYDEIVWGSEFIALTFLTSALDGGEWSVLCPGRFIAGEKPPVFILQEAGWVPEPV
jgi:hypothetical protein